MKIGIFGGSFNPPHLDHLMIGKYFIEHSLVDQLIYVPTGSLYFKKGLLPFFHRYFMLQLMIQDFTSLSISSFENQNKAIFTYQTLDYFQMLYKDCEICFICGSDNLKEFHTWRYSQYILENYKIFAVLRNDDNLSSIIQKFQPTSSILACSIPLMGLSSTYIRNLLRDDFDMEKLVDYVSIPVLEYIKEKKLYRK